METQPKKITVLLDSEEFGRFDAYCESHGFKKSTLICRLIREYLDGQRFRVQGELAFPGQPKRLTS